MKQEALENLKIEDLEEITEVQAFKDGWREMIVWNDEFYPTTPIITSVIAIVNSNGYVRAIGTEDDNKTPFYDHCAEIPQPKMRDMNSLEVIEKLPIIDRESDGIAGWWYKDEGYEFFHKYETYSKNKHLLGDICFGILKNGKITEFKLPQIEV